MEYEDTFEQDDYDYEEEPFQGRNDCPLSRSCEPCITPVNTCGCACIGPRGPRGFRGATGPTGPTGATAPSIYAQQGKCRNHAAFSTLKTIKQPL